MIEISVHLVDQVVFFFVYIPHFVCVCVCVCACIFSVYVPVCLQCKLRFNLLREVSVQSGQYQLPPQSQMEVGWGAWARQTKAAQSPNIITGLREAIKPSLGRLPLLQPEYKPIAFWFVRVIFLSGLVRQHDRWFGLGAACEPILVPITCRTLWYVYMSLLIASACYNLGTKTEEFLQERPQALISDCNMSARM